MLDGFLIIRRLEDARPQDKDVPTGFRNVLDVIDLDSTSSMNGWAGLLAGKTPYLDHEARTEYLGPDYALVLGATGDANSDEYPMQLRPPTSGTTGIKNELKGLITNVGGGGQNMETYELKALYYCRRVSMPNVLIKPALIFVADEKPYPYIEPAQANKFAYVQLTQKLSTKLVFQELMRKFSVYAVLKPYGDIPSDFNFDVLRPIDLEIHSAWQELLELGHVLRLPSPERFVDIVFGILGKECDKVGYFRSEIEERQSKDKGGAKKIEIAYRSLEPLIGPPEPGNPYYQPVNRENAKAKDNKVKPLA